MTLTPAAQKLHQLIQQARASKTTIAGGDASRDINLTDAYHIQAANNVNRRLKGYKFGLISPAKQRQMGLSTPLYGRIYADMLYDGPVSLGSFIQPRLEPEIALVLARDLPPGTGPALAWQAIGGYFLGVDILDSVWQSYKFTASEVAADNTSGGGFVVGSQLIPMMPTGILRLYLNGELQVEGDVAVLGTPAEQLVWLAQTVGGLKAGQLIFLGSPAAAIPAITGTLEVVGSNSQGLIVNLVA